MKIAAVALAFATAAGCAVGARLRAIRPSPITLVVPFPPVVRPIPSARVMADHMKITLGQTVVVENVTGAGGTIGMARVARAAPDGYTLSIGQWTTHVGGGAIYPLQFHVLHDFEPVSLLTSSPLWIVGKNDLPAKDLKELIAWMKASPGKASVATVGAGSAAHMCIGLLSQQHRHELAVRALSRGRTGHAGFGRKPGRSGLPGSLADAGHYRGGKIKVFAVMAKNRFFPAPDVPTVDEAGAPGLHFPFWHGLWVPKGTPKDIVTKLNGAVVAAFDDPGVRKRFADLGMEIPPREQLTPEALYAHHQAEIEKWWPIIKAANIKVQ